MKRIITIAAIFQFLVITGVWAQDASDYYSINYARLEVKKLPGQRVQVTSFYHNGTVKEIGQYLKGKRHGIWKNYHQDGSQNTQAFYNNDRRDGMWTFYTSDGEVRAVIFYDSNEVVQYYEEELAIAGP